MSFTATSRTLVIAGSLSSLLFSATVDAGFFSRPDNYPECILERLEDVQNDQVALSETVECHKAFADSPPPEKIKPGLFGPKTVADCVAAYGGNTASNFAASQIRMACFQLYPETLDGD